MAFTLNDVRAIDTLATAADQIQKSGECGLRAFLCARVVSGFNLRRHDGGPRRPFVVCPETLTA